MLTINYDAVSHVSMFGNERKIKWFRDRTGHMQSKERTVTIAQAKGRSLEQSSTRPISPY